jgi:adenylosuccinate lyase
MGEVSTTPDVAARAIEDLTKMEVDPAKGERLYKAAVVHSNKGATYRMLAKSLKDGRVDLVHYGCTLDDDGNPATKWSIRRILEQKPERFDRELETIKKTIQEGGEEVQGAWVHDLSAIPDVAQQGSSLEAWTKQMAGEIRRLPS